MKYKFNKNEIDMDAANEVFRRMDALEKRVADLKKDVKALQDAKKSKTTKTGTTIKPKTK